MVRSASPAAAKHAPRDPAAGARVLPVAPCPHCGRRFFIPIAVWRAEDPRARCGDCEGVFDVRASARTEAALIAARTGNASARRGPLTAVLPAGIDGTGGIDPDELDYSLANYELPGVESAATATRRPVNAAPQRHGPGKRSFVPANASGIDRLAAGLAVSVERIRRWHSRGSPYPMLGAVATVIALTLVTIPTIYRDSPRVYNERVPRLLASLGCRAFFCEVAPPSFPERFELLRRQVYTHPTRSDTLVLELSFANAADIAQRLPRVELRFADGRGERIGREDLLPRDYAPNWSPGDTIAPGVRQDLRVELPDPGAAASRFDLAFRHDE